MSIISIVLTTLLLISGSIMAEAVPLTNFAEEELQWGIWNDAGNWDFEYVDESWGPEGAKSLLLQADAGGAGQICYYYELPLQRDSIAVRFYIKVLEGNAAFHLMFNDAFGSRLFHLNAFYINELPQLVAGGVDVDEQRKIDGVMVISEPGPDKGLLIEDVGNGWYEVTYYVNDMEFLVEWNPNDRFDRPSRELYLYFWQQDDMKVLISDISYLTE